MALRIILNKVGLCGQILSMQWNSSTVLRTFPPIPISIPWSTNHTHNKCKKNVMKIFSTFKSICLKYLKSLHFGQKIESDISNDMWPHVFRSEVRSYIFIFLVTYLAYIIFSYVIIFHLLRRMEGVGIYYKLISDWIKLTRARRIFTAQYRTGIQNQILNNTWRSISKIS